MSDGTSFPPGRFEGQDQVFSFPEGAEIAFVGQAIQDNKLLALIFIDRQDNQLWEFASNNFVIEPEEEPEIRRCFIDPGEFIVSIDIRNEDDACSQISLVTFNEAKSKRLSCQSTCEKMQVKDRFYFN